MSDFLVGSLPAATGRKMRFTGTTVLKVLNGKIVEEIGLDDGVTALTGSINPKLLIPALGEARTPSCEPRLHRAQGPSEEADSLPTWAHVYR